MVEIKEIRRQIAELPRKKMDKAEQEFVQRYLGSQKKYLGLKTGDVVKIAKEAIKNHADWDISRLIELLDELLLSDVIEEHWIGGKIFSLIKPATRSEISFTQIEKWLSNARGWVEIGTICQSTFTGAEVIARWREWEEAIRKFALSDNISLRRASLVLQTKPVREINDEKLRRLAFEIIEKLKHEKEILITKAVSWLLRSLTFQDKEEVKGYLIKNEPTLPRIAFRETIKKIETGKKTANGKTSNKS